MKKSGLFFIAFLLFAISLSAQELTNAEIRKNRIRKITIYYGEKGKPGTNVSVFYYDANGYDTVQYNDGNRYQYKKNVYDAAQRLLSVSVYSAEGQLAEKSVYTYNPDGSFSEENTDMAFGLKNIAKCDKNGVPVSRTLPDGSIHKYEFNAKGQLVKLYSIPNNGGVKFSRAYTYNAAGKLTASKNTGDFPFTSSYEYDAKGFLIKVSTTTKNESGGNDIGYRYYEYE